MTITLRARARAHAALSALLAAAALAACGGGQPQAPAARAPAVEAVPARSGGLPLVEQLTGTVRARNQVAIRPEVEAIVLEVLVRDGEAVRRGQPLVRLDAERLGEQLRETEASARLAEAAAAEARARLAEVRAQATRVRALVREGLVSELEAETIEAQLEAARAQADQAAAGVEQARAAAADRRSALDRAVVRAPISGRVGQREVEPGMLVDPSTVLFVVGELDRLVVEVPVTEEMLAHVGTGTPVEIAARSLTDPVRASVSRISPFLEPGSFSTRAEIDLANPGGLRPGMPVTVSVLYGESERATLIPASALWEDPRTGRRGVWLVTAADGLEEPSTPGGDVPDEARPVAFRPVEVRAEGGGRVGVAGIAEGDWVVTVGQHLLGRRQEGGDAGRVTARVRPTSWERVVSLQELQREDLLRAFVEKQRRVARALGAEIPESEAVVQEILRNDSPKAETLPGGS